MWSEPNRLSLFGRSTPPGFRSRTPLLALLLLALALGGCDLFGDDEPAPQVQLFFGNVNFDTSAQPEVGGAGVLFRVHATPRGGGGIERVALYLDGDREADANLIGSDGTTQRYAYRLNTSSLENGAHRLEAVAISNDGARGLSAPLRFSVLGQSADGPIPEVTFVFPQPVEDAAQAPVVSGVLPIQFQTSRPVIRYDVLVDGLIQAVQLQEDGAFDANQMEFTYNLATSALQEGPRKVEIRAFSEPGVFGVSDDLTLDVELRDPVNCNTLAQGERCFRTAGIAGTPVGTPAVGFSNRTYVATADDGNGRLFVLDGDGYVLRRMDLEDDPVATPMIDNVGNVYVPLEDEIVSFSEEGAERWSRSVRGADVRTPLVLSADGRVFFGDSDGRMHCLSSAGNSCGSAWPVQVSLEENPITAPPVITPERVLIANADGRLYGLNEETGGLRWQGTYDGQATYVGAAVEGMAVADVEGDSHVYMLSSTGYVYGFDAFTGDRVFRYPSATDSPLEAPLRSGVVVGPGGLIYFGTGVDVRAIDPTESGDDVGVWKRNNVRAPSTPALDDDGAIYMYTNGGILALDADDGDYLFRYDVDGEAQAPLTIRPDGLLLVAGTNNALIGLATGSDGPAQEGWPMYQFNARHIGRALGL